MSEFIKYINNVSPLTSDAETDCLSRLKTKTFKKGEMVNKQGHICKKVYFIEKGLVKHYFHKKDRVFIIRFFSDNNLFTVLESFITQNSSTFTTETMEDTFTTYFDLKDIEELSKKHHCFETFMRKTYATASIINLNRILEMLQDDSTELYKKFIVENQKLLHRISLGDIASYIGISQVSLSRIRANI